MHPTAEELHAAAPARGTLGLVLVSSIVAGSVAGLVVAALGSRGTAPAPSATPVDLAPVACIALTKGDPATARADVWLLTVPELVRRFGSPTQVQDSNGMIYVEYALHRKGDPYLGHISFQLRDGYVVHHESRLPWKWSRE